MYQHLFSCSTVLSVWKNLRGSGSPSDLILTFQSPYDKKWYRTTGTKRLRDNGEDDDEDDEGDGRFEVQGKKEKSKRHKIIIPWKSIQGQKEKLKAAERQVADVVVTLCGETSFSGLPSHVQNSARDNPFVEVRHLAAGISRLMSQTENLMIDNAPYYRGKNIYTGGELIRKFLPDIQAMFEQERVPYRMIWELLMELKDLVYYGMQCLEDSTLLEDELSGYDSFDLFDEALARCLEHKDAWLYDEDEVLWHLESLETTTSAMSRVGVEDFCAKSTITMRRLLDKRVLYDFGGQKRRRQKRCKEYARCMRWAGTAWKQAGGCRRGCANEDDDPKALPSWHSTSRHFAGSGKFPLDGGKVALRS